MKQMQQYSAKKQGRIMLNANEMYRDVDEDVRKAIIQRFETLSLNRYPDETSADLIQAYANVIQKDPACIIAGNGSDEMLGFMIGTYLGKGKTLVTLKPDFSMYDYYASMQEANVKKYETNEDGSFSIDGFIDFAKAQQADLILFSNPNNPTGYAQSNEALISLVNALPNTPIIIDEAYGEFADETMLDEVGNYDNLFVTRTLSKAYGLAGARLGFLIGKKEVIEKLRGAIVPYNISSVDQMVGEVVLSYAARYQERIELVKQERDVFYDTVKDYQSMRMYPSKANYIYGRCPKKAQLFALFEEQDIVLRTYQDDSFRITIGSVEENKIVKAILKQFEEGERV